jgi:hypothetical protein
MSKKSLDVAAITNELEGASLFFTKPAEPTPEPKSDVVTGPSSTESTPEPSPLPPAQTQKVQSGKKADEIIEQKRDNASKLASIQTDQHDRIETIRKTVKQVGKEVLFVRISPEEKRAIGSIVYSFNEIYRGEGRKTSENEIGRVALNFLLEDYKENGNNSFIARVLAALNA